MRHLIINGEFSYFYFNNEYNIHEIKKWLEYRVKLKDNIFNLNDKDTSKAVILDYNNIVIVSKNPKDRIDIIIDEIIPIHIPSKIL